MRAPFMSCHTLIISGTSTGSSGYSFEIGLTIPCLVFTVADRLSPVTLSSTRPRCHLFLGADTSATNTTSPSVRSLDSTLFLVVTQVDTHAPIFSRRHLLANCLVYISSGVALPNISTGVSSALVSRRWLGVNGSRSLGS